MKPRGGSGRGSGIRSKTRVARSSNPSAAKAAAEAPSFKIPREISATNWSSVFGSSLELGCWSLELHKRGAAGLCGTSHACAPIAATFRL